MNLAHLADRLAGGLLPLLRRREREVFVVDGAAYSIELVWFRRSLQLRYHTPRLPRDVRAARAADAARGVEIARRHRAGEPALQVGDQIPGWAVAFVERCQEVRANDGTRWRRAVGDERRVVEEGGWCDGQEYEWIAFLAGEWGGGWCTTEGLLDHAPLTALELIDRAAA